jgi:plasmid stabilization system protein ParE
MPHRLTKRAQADIDEIARFISHEGGLAAAASVVEGLARAFQMLSDHPYSGRSRALDLGSDRRSITAAGYVIVYRVIRSDAVILRVVDGRRDYPAFL